MVEKVSGSFGVNQMPMSLFEILQNIGWNAKQFVNECSELTIPNPNFDWSKLLKSLWTKTHYQIYYNLDMKHNFVYYNDWQVIVDFAIEMNTYFDNKQTLNLSESELIHKLQKKRLFPCDPKEKCVVWNLCASFLLLYRYLKMDAEKTFVDIEEIRNTNKAASEEETALAASDN